MSGHLLLRPLARACLALTVDLPYALERVLLPRLLRQPVFEPATPAQLAAVSTLWGGDGAASAPPERLDGAIEIVPNSTVAGQTTKHEREYHHRSARQADAECISGI